MRLSDEDFNRYLCGVCAATRSTLDKGRHSTWLLTLTGIVEGKNGELEGFVDCLVGKKEEEDTSPNDLVLSFGRRVAEQRRAPLAVLVTSEAYDNTISIFASTADGRLAAATIPFTRRRDGTIRPGEPRVFPFEPGQREWSSKTNPAVLFYRGFKSARKKRRPIS